ncbi:hypothetical protein KSS87_005307, partial [Heliosperma pusillum]
MHYVDRLVGILLYWTYIAKAFSSILNECRLDMKCVGLQYIEAIRKLKESGFEPTRTIYLSYVPDEEIGGRDGAQKLAESDVFKEMNVAFVLDEGMPSSDENYRAYYAERSPMWLVIKATGAPGHGAKLYDNTAMENLLKSIESIRRYRASEFDMVKSGLKMGGEAISVNLVYLNAGTQSPTGFVMNMQPSEAEAGIDIRVPPTADQAALEKRIADEWAPASRNMTFEYKQKVSVLDKFGKPALTKVDSSNPWWTLLEEAILNAGGKLEKPEIFFGSTDARFFRQQGFPAIGFSPISNTPPLFHDHNEFLNEAEYMKGVDIYASIIKAYASYSEQLEEPKAENGLIANQQDDNVAGSPAASPLGRSSPGFMVVLLMALKRTILTDGCRFKCFTSFQAVFE